MVSWVWLVVIGYAGLLIGLLGAALLRTASDADNRAWHMEVAAMGEVNTVHMEAVGPSVVLLERNDLGWRVAEERNGLYTIHTGPLPETEARARFAERVAELRELAAALESVEPQP